MSKQGLDASTYGLRVDPTEIRYLLGKIGTSLQRALTTKFVKVISHDRGSQELHYFTINPPLQVATERGALPCLPIDVGSGYFLVVEVQIGRAGNDRGAEQFIEHISIKTLEGAAERASLLFRAEWDARHGGLSHAQPHWNIHAETPVEEGGFSAFVQRERELGFMSKDTAPKESTFERVKLHFALASTWQNDGGGHSCKLQSVDDVPRWIEGCCAYLFSQLSFASS